MYIFIKITFLGENISNCFKSIVNLASFLKNFSVAFLDILHPILSIILSEKTSLTIFCWTDFQSILFKSIAILFAILKWKCIAILQFCNIAPPEKVLQYCNTSILFTERKPIIHKFDSAYIGGLLKNFSTQILE